MVLAVCAALLGPALFGIALGYTSPCLTPLAADMGLTTLQASTFASVINLGAVCSGLFGMRYVETLGRKTCLIVTGALYAAGGQNCLLRTQREHPCRCPCQRTG